MWYTDAGAVARGTRPEPPLVTIRHSMESSRPGDTSDGKSIILVDNAALVLQGLGTGDYASGKFFGIENAILIGSQRPDYLFRGQPKKSYDAQVVDLEALLKGAK